MLKSKLGRYSAATLSSRVHGLPFCLWFCVVCHHVVFSTLVSVCDESILILVIGILRCMQSLSRWSDVLSYECYVECLVMHFCKAYVFKWSCAILLALVTACKHSAITAAIVRMQFQVGALPHWFVEKNTTSILFSHEDARQILQKETEAELNCLH